MRKVRCVQNYLCEDKRREFIVGSHLSIVRMFFIISKNALTQRLCTWIFKTFRQNCNWDFEVDSFILPFGFPFLLISPVFLFQVWSFSLFLFPDLVHRLHLSHHLSPSSPFLPFFSPFFLWSNYVALPSQRWTQIDSVRSTTCWIIGADLIEIHFLPTTEHFHRHVLNKYRADLVLQYVIVRLQSM